MDVSLAGDARLTHEDWRSSTGDLPAGSRFHYQQGDAFAAIAAAVSGLQPRQQTLSILIAASLICAHPFKFGFGFGGFFVLALHFDDERLLLCEPPFALDDIALDLPQLVVYRSRVHGDPRADVLRVHGGE